MRCTLPRLVRKNSKLSLWSLFIKGMMVQLDFTPRFRTAYTEQRWGRTLPHLPSPVTDRLPWPNPGRPGAHLQQ